MDPEELRTRQIHVAACRSEVTELNTVVETNLHEGGPDMYQVNIEDCSGCETCIDVCPTEAISMVDGHASIDLDECVECGSCLDECPEGAIIEAD